MNAIAYANGVQLKSGVALFAGIAMLDGNVGLFIVVQDKTEDRRTATSRLGQERLGLLLTSSEKGLSMNASYVMITDVTTVKPNTKVREVAEILVTKRISGMPVVDDSGKVVGMISEGDLLRRSAEGAWPKAWGPPPRRGWVRLLMDGDDSDTEYATQPDRRVAEIMTYDVISAEPETSVSDIATLLVHHRIKRVPIVRNGKLVGLVSRANIVEALARGRRKEKDVPLENHVRG